MDQPDTALAKLIEQGAVTSFGREKTNEARRLYTEEFLDPSSIAKKVGLQAYIVRSLIYQFSWDDERADNLRIFFDKVGSDLQTVLPDVGERQDRIAHNIEDIIDRHVQAVAGVLDEDGYEKADIAKLDKLTTVLSKIAELRLSIRGTSPAKGPAVAVQINNGTHEARGGLDMRMLEGGKSKAPSVESEEDVEFESGASG